ncbi:MAG: glycerophosphodiester phosphodiesterase [Actinomycetota bacterium]|nr:glycerophosphodiester phosphodiesterase [Actinomycetota bacterium]
MTPRFRFLESPAPIALAHRGGAQENPENTWAAFSHAVEHLDYRYIETDVHATADGVVAVIHDPGLARTTDRAGAIAELTWSEVARARIADDQAVPRLDEVLAAWPNTRWNIDAKHDAVVGPLLEVVRRAGAVERVCITAFSDRRLRRIRRAAGPTLCTAMGPAAIASLRAASFARSVVPATSWRAAGAAQVPLAQGRLSIVDPRFIAAAHRGDLAVHAWTINDAATMERLVDLGVDGIMTDQPTLLRTVLDRRGLWPPQR